MNRSELERWLGQVLVPVEPPEPFTTRLKARLVELRGARPAGGWLTLAAGVVIVLGLAVWLGAAVRTVVAIVTIVGLLLGRRRRGGAR